MQEMQVQYLGQEDPQEKEMATHSCILAWKIPWTEEPGGLQSRQLQNSQTQLMYVCVCIKLGKTKPKHVYTTK